ncbi:hypothetical protein PR048_020261 [Dryococelus australis]|uniref:Uncharacterized protein n=1 Tax=Dryococelus australis TaxID=614101 RepID=A0ABQ9H662_9NEOP|nr:hypothetical protein PR048_020261 [Dryococelus australis]
MQAYFAALLQVNVENGTELHCKRLHKEKVRYGMIKDKVVQHQRLLYKPNIHNEYIVIKRFEAET